MVSKKIFLLAAAIAIFSQVTGAAVDLGTYKGCTVTDANFTSRTLVPKSLAILPSGVNGNFDGILKMALVKNKTGLTDIYYIRKAGDVFRYNGTKIKTDVGTISDLGTIDIVYAKDEYGLVGIAADPNFLENRNLYFIYSTSQNGANLKLELSRISLNSDFSNLDLTTKKVLLTILLPSAQHHSGGAMAFDELGDLYCAIGDNDRLDDGPGNTADLRGGILRIHPDNSTRGYSIPKGNFSEMAAAYFNSIGKSTIAGQYLDTSKVKPEIYIKGTRNAYTMHVQNQRPSGKPWVVWGDVGPDRTGLTEEFNLATNSTYGGWPYYAGLEDMNGFSPYGMVVNIGTKEAPINSSAKNGTVKGVAELPPILEPAFTRTKNCAMVGPILSYDGRLTSDIQIPPQFNGKWIMSGCDGWGFHLGTFDDKGKVLVPPAVSTPPVDTKLFGISTNNLVDIQQGPDGAIYYIEWGNDVIRRIEYNPTSPATACTDATLFPAALTVSNLRRNNLNMPSMAFRLNHQSIVVDLNAAYQLQILDLNGKIIKTYQGRGEASYDLPMNLGAGIYNVILKSPSGVQSIRVLNRVSSN